MSDPAQEFDELVAAVCHGTASESQMRSLAARLTADAEARADYLRRIDLHASMAGDDTLFTTIGDAAGQGAGALAFPSFGGQTPEETSSRRLPVAALLAVAAIVTGAIITVALLWRPGETRATAGAGDTSPLETEDELAEGPPAIASITQSVDARWRGSEPPVDINEPRTLELLAGLAQIECSTGVVLVAEGPLKAELLSESALRLEHGKIRARVPEQANGFTLYTPNLKIVDLGTDFAVGIEADGQGEIHVFEGMVDIIQEGGNRDEPRRLSGGEALSFDFRRPGGRLATRPLNPSAFLGIQEVGERARELRLRQREEWKGHLDTLAGDPSLRVLLTFDDHESWERTVRNLATAKGKGSDGALVGCQWTRGRWPEKDALDFHRPGDRVRLHVGGESDAFTLSTWVYLPAAGSLRPRTLFSATPSGHDTSLAPEWQLVRDGGIALSLRRTPEDRNLVFRQTDVLPQGEARGWTHLAVTYSAVAGDGLATVRFYVDGMRVFEKTRKSPLPVALGRCDLGNSIPLPRDAAISDARRKPAKRPGTSPFVGLIDEFACFARALSPSEISSIWRAGAQVPPLE